MMPQMEFPKRLLLEITPGRQLHHLQSISQPPGEDWDKSGMHSEMELITWWRLWTAVWYNSRRLSSDLFSFTLEPHLSTWRTCISSGSYVKEIQIPTVLKISVASGFTLVPFHSFTHELIVVIEEDRWWDILHTLCDGVLYSRLCWAFLLQTLLRSAIQSPTVIEVDRHWRIRRIPNILMKLLLGKFSWSIVRLLITTRKVPLGVKSPLTSCRHHTYESYQLFWKRL